MEYELFRSKLKHQADRTLISNIIDSSSSGEHPHRSEAMALVIERSIQERRERMLKKKRDVPSTPTKAGKETKVGRLKEPLTTNAGTSPSLEQTVKLACNCGAVLSDSSIHGLICRDRRLPLRCAHCLVERLGNAKVCVGCHGKFGG